LLAIAAQEQLPHKHRIDWQTRPPAAPHPGSHIATALVVPRGQAPVLKANSIVFLFKRDKRKKSLCSFVSIGITRLLIWKNLRHVVEPEIMPAW